MTFRSPEGHLAIIDPAIGWFNIFEMPMFDLEEVKIGNDEYIYISSSRFSQLFNNTWLCRYPRPHKVVVYNGYDFKRDFNPLLKEFYVKPVLTSVKNPQANTPFERVHQVISSMLVTKDIYNKVFDYIDPWVETLASISWA